MEEPVESGQPTREEATRLLKAGAGKAMQMAAANYVMPICWIAAEGGRPIILDNGSAFLLDCGNGPFGVTAGHVYQGYRKACENRGDAVCILGDIRFDLAGRLIAHDPVYDVATFRVSSGDVAAIRRYGKVPLTGSQTSWPPNPPKVGRGVFFIGFPGDGRKMRPYRGGSLVEIDWNGYTALAVADSVSETGITVVRQHDPDLDVGLRPAAPPDWALGGCSGAPLLTFVEQRKVFSWRLGGIVYESGELLVKASRADCLNPDGTINPYPNPMAYYRQIR